jgi:Fic family protein
MNADWAQLLESRARLLEAVGSIGIEGTVVSMDQARALTEGDKSVEIGEKERREFEGYYESLQFIKDNVESPLSVSLLLRIHEKVTRGDEAAKPGTVRTDLRQIKSKGKVIFTPPPPAQLELLLREFIIWFNKTAADKESSPTIAAAICHFWFVWIHPFCDGNGRTSRILTTFLLMKKKSEGVKYFALSDYYNTHKDAYYDALEQTNVCNPLLPSMNFVNDLTPWVNYFVESFLEQMESVKEITNRILQLNIRVDHLRRNGLIADSHNKVLSFLSSREKASYSELVAELDVSKQRVNQILAPLRESQILVEEKIGAHIWFKLGSPENETREDVLNKKKVVKENVDGRPVDKKIANNTAAPRQIVIPIFE